MTQHAWRHAALAGIAATLLVGPPAGLAGASPLAGQDLRAQPLTNTVSVNWPLQATSQGTRHSTLRTASGPTVRKKLYAGPVKGCRGWKGTIESTHSLGEFAYRLGGHCYGKPLRLRFRQGWNGLGYQGTGRVLGRKVRYSGSLDDSSTHRVRLTLGSRALTTYGDGAWHSGSHLAGFSLGQTSFYCIREDSDGRGRWSVRMATMSIGGTHYHGTPTRSQRRGLPFALCVTLLQTSENLLPTNW